MIRCRTPGTVELTVDGAAAPPQLTWRKHLGLLVYLGRSPRLRRSREHLVGLLWSEKEETAARHSLNEAIRVIRRAGGDEALASETGQIRLAADAVSFDVDELARAVAAGNWSTAADLVNREFLEGFSIPQASEFEDWLTSERRHWARESLKVLVQRGEELLTRGQGEAAATLAERAWQLDPVAEMAAAFVMRALALGGNRAAALTRYDQFVTRLRTEVGTEPGIELRALAQRLREDGSASLPHRGKERNGSHVPLLSLGGNGNSASCWCSGSDAARKG